MVIEAHELFELVAHEQTLRSSRLRKARGLGYFRVGAAFIGLPSNGRDAVRSILRRRTALGISEGDFGDSKTPAIVSEPKSSRATSPCPDGDPNTER